MPTDWVERLYQAPVEDLAHELAQWPHHVWQGTAVIERLFLRDDAELTQAVVNHLGAERACTGNTFATAVLNGALRCAAVLLGHPPVATRIPVFARTWIKASQWDALLFVLPHVDVPRDLNETGTARALVLNAPVPVLAKVLAQTPNGPWKRKLFDDAMDLAPRPDFLHVLQQWGHPLSQRQATSALAVAALAEQAEALTWLWPQANLRQAVEQLAEGGNWEALDRVGPRLAPRVQRRLLQEHGDRLLPHTARTAQAQQRHADASPSAPRRERARLRS